MVSSTVLARLPPAASSSQSNWRALSMAMTASSRAPQDGRSRETERSPFIRLTELLAPYSPGKPLITLSLGEPQHPLPDFVGPVLARHTAEFGRYPVAKGIEPFRKAAADWLARRFTLPRPISPDSEVLVLNGSREGLFFTALTAVRYAGERAGPPAILMPNPFYSVYGAGAHAAGCEQIYLPTTATNGFLPDLDAISEATLARAVAFYIASPANPQGSVASIDYFTRLKELADRVGFASGDRKFLNMFHELRNVAAPQVPVPLQHVAVAAYGDEAHVEDNRRLYRSKFDLADQILKDKYGYHRPAGGFCLWLDVSRLGGDEAVTVKLYKEAGVRVVPGSYLARQQPDGFNPGAGFIRLALVQDGKTTAEALHRLVETLG